MKQKNIRLFFIHESLFQFSDSMLIVVLPIFIYKLFGSISAVFLFQVTWNLIYAALFIPVFNMGMRWGKPKYIMGLGIIFYIIAFLFFGHINQDNLILIIPAAIIFALYVAFYWMTRHWFFSVNADYQKIGKQISYLTIIRIFIGFIAPVIGGILSFKFSFNAPFILGSVTGFLSLIPIFLFHAPPHLEQYSWKKIKKILKKPELKAIRPAYFWEGVSHYLIDKCWVLAFAIFIGSIKDLGILVGVTTLIAAILTRLTGHWFDKKHRTLLLTHLTKLRALMAILYASVFFYPHLGYVWIVNLLNRFASTMHQTTIDSYLFGHSNKIHPVYFHLNREIHLTIGRTSLSALLAIIFYFLPDNFLWLCIGIGAIMILGWLNLKKGDHLLH